ncbi:C-type lectin lectoxin-Phi1-like [Fundulus heteroclitus]|uniref:C-type lectin lectoxin-Phi1-like n=1 Tax=Fundulus heteroclitus TaxID=8078 RepID=UPI00165C6DC7|nr:C-type lectin lectoxin-Phi1-like [Fundulus heteroclitus]
MTWTAAQKYCRDHHSDLASVRNMTENQKIQQLVPAGDKVWIGLYRDTWKWSDGRNFSLSYWNSVEPNNKEPPEICVAAAFDAEGKWEDWPCEIKRTFICYSYIPVSKKVLVLKLEKTTNLDLNDHAVLEELLNQLKQKLKEQGLNEDIQLSWRKQSDENVFHKEKNKQTSV